MCSQWETWFVGCHNSGTWLQSDFSVTLTFLCIFLIHPMSHRNILTIAAKIYGYLYLTSPNWKSLIQLWKIVECHRSTWILIRRANTEAEAPILWPPDVKSQFIGKDLDAGKNRGQEEKGVTKDKMVGWHHQLNGHEFEQALQEAWHAAVYGVTKSWTKPSKRVKQQQQVSCFTLLKRDLNSFFRFNWKHIRFRRLDPGCTGQPSLLQVSVVLALH